MEATLPQHWRIRPMILSMSVQAFYATFVLCLKIIRACRSSQESGQVRAVIMAGHSQRGHTSRNDDIEHITVSFLSAVAMRLYLSPYFVHVRCLRRVVIPKTQNHDVQI